MRSLDSYLTYDDRLLTSKKKQELEMYLFYMPHTLHK